MKATELHKLAPLGAMVRFSNGKPQPPARHNKKLRAWKSLNDAGRLVKCHSRDASNEYDRDHITIQTENGDVVVVNRIFSADDTELDFTIEAMPTPGTILAHSDYDRDELEIRHVWNDVAAAREWEKRRRYKLNKCGLAYLIVGDDGALNPYTFAEEKETA